ncbi:hypothetical protein [Streptomyces werraensis]|uniref:WDGH domain-containing protein n=1 Tax=Streptomyces werraensis TaxID=68284 RepID=UPI003436A21D
MSIYTERAHLVAVLVALFGGVLSHNDSELPDYPVLYIETPTGQMSWHIHPDDVWLFPKVPTIGSYPWDKHTTRVKYKRLRSLTEQLPKMTYANPTYGQP